MMKEGDEGAGGPAGSGRHVHDSHLSSAGVGYGVMWARRIHTLTHIASRSHLTTGLCALS